MSNFTKSENQAIAAFFGKKYNPKLFSLSPVYTLESDSVQHPIGDRLEIVNGRYVVTLQGSTSFPDPRSYLRDSGGLQLALKALTQG